MKFEQALATMREGKKIRSKEWHNHQWFWYLTDKKDKILDASGNQMSINTFDILSGSWEIYEEPKWEPKDGDWVIHNSGEIYHSDVKSFAVRDFGLYRKNRAQAEAARDKMRSFNRLLAYVDEHSKDNEVRNFAIFKSKRTNDWQAEIMESYFPDCVLMSLRVADQLCKDLNSGKVVL